MLTVSSSYEEQIKNCSSTVEKVSLLNKIASETFRLDTAQAIKFASEALMISEQLNYEKGQIDASVTIAQCFWLSGDYSQAVNHLDKILPRINNGDYVKENAEVLNIFGSIYSSMNKLPEAENYFKQALDLRKIIGDGEGIVRTMNSIGDTLLKQKKYNEALDLFLQTQKIEHTNEIFKGIILYNIAEASFNLDRYKECQESISACLEIGKKLKFPLMLIYCNSLLGKIEIKRKNFHQAEELLLEALKSAREIKNSERSAQILSDLSQVYELIGDIPKAFSYFKQFRELKDTIITTESNERLKAIEYRNALELARKETEHERIRNKELQEANSAIDDIKNILAHKNLELTDSIRYARRIQDAMLVTPELINGLFPENFVIYRPKDVLSGDFYWASGALTKYNEKIAMAAVADCTGHGVPGALMSIIGNNFLRICEHEPSVNRPSEALDYINTGISQTLRQEYSKSKIRDGMDMVFVAIDYEKMLLHFAGAKNSIYIVRNKILTEYKGDKHPIGAFEGEEMLKFTNHSIPVQKGDLLYLFTDGFADQFGGPKGKKFTYKRFKEHLINNSHLTLNEQSDKLSTVFDEWMGKLEQLDDICVMGIRI